MRPITCLLATSNKCDLNVNQIRVKDIKTSLGHRSCIIRDESIWRSCFPKMCAGDFGNENPIIPAMTAISWTPQNTQGVCNTKDLHLSTTVGAMGDVRASIYLRGVTSLFPPCLSVLLSAGCFKYIRGGHYNFLHRPLACRAKGLISS